MREPINPADIRVGDRVERVWVSEHEAGTNVFVVGAFNPETQTLCPGKSPVGYYWSSLPTLTVEWYLLDRPDPLAEIVEVVQASLLVPLPGTGPALSREVANQIVAAITERWELAKKEMP